MFKALVIGVACVCAFTIELGFIHRHFFCAKDSTKKCTNFMCEFYGNGMCERSREK